MIEITDTSYTPKKEDVFLFDNSVWMFIYCPIAYYNGAYQIDKYSEFYKKIIEAGSKICLTSLTLSEFYNSNLRLEYNIWGKKPENKGKSFKKHFKKTSKYETLVGQILYIINTILNIETIIQIDDKFNIVDTERLFTGIKDSDFTDNYLGYLADIEKITVVTDDFDFYNLNFSYNIITANNKLLAQT